MKLGTGIRVSKRASRRCDGNVQTWRARLAERRRERRTRRQIELYFFDHLIVSRSHHIYYQQLPDIDRSHHDPRS